jgi:hypothetical protein
LSVIETTVTTSFEEKLRDIGKLLRVSFQHGTDRGNRGLAFGVCSNHKTGGQQQRTTKKKRGEILPEGTMKNTTTVHDIHPFIYRLAVSYTKTG